jgi:hypothetical protein
VRSRQSKPRVAPGCPAAEAVDFLSVEDRAGAESRRSARSDGARLVGPPEAQRPDVISGDGQLEQVAYRQILPRRGHFVVVGVRGVALTPAGERFGNGLSTTATVSLKLSSYAVGSSLLRFVTPRVTNILLSMESRSGCPRRKCIWSPFLEGGHLRRTVSSNWSLEHSI